jgi:hypothetical protein
VTGRLGRGAVRGREEAGTPTTLRHGEQPAPPGGTRPAALDGETVHVALAQGGDIRYRRSPDGGGTWGHEARLTRDGN